MRALNISDQFMDRIIKRLFGGDEPAEDLIYYRNDSAL